MNNDINNTLGTTLSTVSKLTDSCNVESPTPGIYKHYKGRLYEVLFIAKHTETLEELVVYRSMYDAKNQTSSLWVRPRSMFIEHVELDGLFIPRFSKQSVK